MKTVTKAQENAEDIYEKAQDINEQRIAEEEAALYEDFCVDDLDDDIDLMENSSKESCDTCE